MIMKTYFVFLSLFVLTAARQIQIKNLKEEKQEKVLHSSPISRPLKRSRRDAFWKKEAKWIKKEAKWTKKEAKWIKKEAKWTKKEAKDTGKKALCTDSTHYCA